MRTIGRIAFAAVAWLFLAAMVVAAALHPVNALAIFGLAVAIARRSLAMAREPVRSAAAGRPAQATEPLPPH